MGALLSPCYGAVAVARDCPDKKILTVQFDGSPLNALVTGLTLEMSGNYQFLHTLNELVYFYAFGDRVGTLAVTGLGFTAACDGASKGSILSLYDYYQSNRAAKSGNEAIKIVIEDENTSITLWGFLTGMRIDVSDGQMGTIGYWTLRFEVIPDQ
jgi:hypothetical protein